MDWKSPFLILYNDHVLRGLEKIIKLWIMCLIPMACIKMLLFTDKHIAFAMKAWWFTTYEWTIADFGRSFKIYTVFHIFPCISLEN